MPAPAVVIPAFNEELRIGHALESLAGQQEVEPGRHDIVVVDNGSSDQTAEIVAGWQGHCGPFAVHLVTEGQKGVGYACNTGFNYAIEELSADVVARIDADTMATPLWYQAIQARFGRKPDTALVTGPVKAGLDEGGPTLVEARLLPLIKLADRGMKAMRFASLGMLRFARGHNMATSAAAFAEVGGFPNSDNLHSVSDDVEYSRRIAKAYGLPAMAYEPAMAVITSQRRLRTMGYLTAAGFYISDNPQRRLRLTAGEPDCR